MPESHRRRQTVLAVLRITLTLTAIAVLLDLMISVGLPGQA
jgi:hypothetical protein